MPRNVKREKKTHDGENQNSLANYIKKSIGITSSLFLFSRGLFEVVGTDCP
jgi:hypothetical protein